MLTIYLNKALEKIKAKEEEDRLEERIRKVF